MLLDLDGFKIYNDTYGHPAGDALLARLGHQLAATAGEGVAAYRLGGDEFCVLAQDADRAQEHARTASAALCEHGDGFEITSSYGFATMPKDAQDAGEALRIADQRMYTQKHGRESSAGRQSKNVLLSALVERNPGLVHHLTDVAELAVDVARLLDLPEHEIEQVRHAAELHDVGKVAIPDAILQKKRPPHRRRVALRTRTHPDRRTHHQRRTRPHHTSQNSSAPATNAGTAPATPTGSPPTKSRSAPASSPPATPSPPWSPTAPTAKPSSSPQHSKNSQRCAGTQFDPAVVTALTAA